jgi:hypothetical protein
VFLSNALNPLDPLYVQSGGMQDPNADFAEIFETLESLPSAPKKLLDGFGRWLRCALCAMQQLCGPAHHSRLPLCILHCCSGKDDPTWKR